MNNVANRKTRNHQERNTPTLLNNFKEFKNFATSITSMKNILTIHLESKWKEVYRTLAMELNNMQTMLIQIELTVIAGDHKSYKISTHIFRVKENNIGPSLLPTK